MSRYLAIDIGASGGRHILGTMENGVLRLEEIYRFENGMKKHGDSLVWDTESLFAEVKNGIKKCKELDKLPTTVAIDTWGVDYVLLDKDEKEIYPVFAYRDSRTDGIPEEIDSIIPRRELYSLTGIQKQNFNTIYQLYCDKKSGRLDRAEHFLMIPEYLSYKLTSVMRNEYTEASTSGLLNAEQKTWDESILSRLGIDKRIFKELSLPGTEVGSFTEEVIDEVGFNATVILCPSHDTASAVAACPVTDSAVYISSGTWSLIGTENKSPVVTDLAREENFTNEGGIEYRYRFLRNIMGMWLFQSIRKDLGKKYTYDEMMYMAMDSGSFERIDPNADEFVAPDNMIEAIKSYIGKGDIPLGVLINSVYHSLALTYADAIKVIEEISGKTIDRINVVGGGSKDRYLNELMKKYTGKRVFAGPIEATATGNLLSQMMRDDSNMTLDKARELISRSFDIYEV